jgi:AraC family transcriptional regulator, activator of mtrCDE
LVVRRRSRPGSITIVTACRDAAKMSDAAGPRDAGAVQTCDRTDQSRRGGGMTETTADDALSGLAPLLRVRPVLDDVCRLGGAWTSPHAPEPNGHAYFHIVTRGRTRLDLPGTGLLPLEAGDVLLLPHGDAHTMRAVEGAAPSRSETAIRRVGALSLKTSVGVEPDVELICGRLRFEAAPQSLILAALPDTIVLRVGQRSLAARYSPLVAAMREELSDLRSGALAIAEDLASALFIMLLRAHLEAAVPAEGLLRLLGQRVTAQAVLAMVRDPVRAWTLDELATVAAASRASLVRAFRKTAGMAPLAFLADLRLGLARHRLRTEAASLDRIAAEVGYQSQAALSRAFLRKYGVRPGSLRRTAGGRDTQGDRPAAG